MVAVVSEVIGVAVVVVVAALVAVEMLVAGVRRSRARSSREETQDKD